MADAVVAPVARHRDPFDLRRVTASDERVARRGATSWPLRTMRRTVVVVTPRMRAASATVMPSSGRTSGWYDRWRMGVVRRDGQHYRAAAALR